MDHNKLQNRKGGLEEESAALLGRSRRKRRVKGECNLCKLLILMSLELL